MPMPYHQGLPLVLYIYLPSNPQDQRIRGCCFVSQRGTWHMHCGETGPGGELDTDPGPYPTAHPLPHPVTPQASSEEGL